MTKLRKMVTAAAAFATLSAGAYLMPTTMANAGGYYSPNNGYYGKPYYAPTYHAPRCHWVKYKYRSPYGYGWQWGKRWVCN